MAQGRRSVADEAESGDIPSIPGRAEPDQGGPRRTKADQGGPSRAKADQPGRSDDYHHMMATRGYTQGKPD